MARVPLALVSADWHVRRADRIWYKRDEISGDTGYSVRQIVDIANGYCVPNVILAGDLFDMKLQQSDALRTMRLALDDFIRHGRSVYYIQGQHERSAPPLLAALHSWPTHIHKQRIVLGDLTVYGLDYCNPTEVRAELAAVPEDTDILVTHQVWKDFLGDRMGDAWLRWAKAPFVISGDYHRTLFERRGEQQVMSPGSICMQKIDEVPQKYVYILFDDLSAEQVRLKTRACFTANVMTPEELELFVDNWDANPARVLQPEVWPNIAVNLLRVRYRADLPQAKKRLEAAIGTSAHLFADPVRVQAAEQISAEQMRRITAVTAGGLEGCISEFYADNPRVRDMALRLARTSNIQTELLAIYQEALNGVNSHREGAFSDTAETARR